MAEDGVQLVREVYAPWARGEFLSTAGAFDPEVEFAVEA
jgi:hypothetical protein